MDSKGSTAMKKLYTDEDWQALRFQAGDLFTPSSPVAETQLFAGRQSQISKLCMAIAERGRHAILYGEPGVGKTSIAKLLRYFVPHTPKPVHYIRKPVVSTDDFVSIWGNVFRNIKYTEFQEGRSRDVSVAEIYPDSITPSDVVRELSNFGEACIPVIVIDEFQQLENSETAKLMSETVKAVSDEGVNATIIVVGVGDSVDELVRGHSSIIRCSEEVLMPRMKKEELQELLNVRISQLGMSLEGNAKWKMIGLAKGLPSFAHALGRSSVYSAIDRKSLRVTESDVDAGIVATIESSQQTLKFSYADATNSNHNRATFKQLITACALVKVDESGWFVPKDIEIPFSDIMGDHRKVEGFNDNLKDFATDKRGNILQQRGAERNFRFRFTEPAMQPYVLMRGIEAGFITKEAMIALSSPEQPDLFSNVP